MDALGQRELVEGRALELERGSLAGRILGRRPLLSRGWLAAALATVGLLAAGWFNIVSLPTGFSVVETTRGTLVESVGVGSNAWLEGIRAPMSVERGDDGYLLVAIGRGLPKVGFPTHRAGDFAFEWVFGAVLVLGAAVLAYARLPGSAAAAGGGVAVALGPALPFIGLPTALPLVLLSALTAAAAVRIPNHRAQRSFDAFAVAVFVAVTAAALALMNGFEPDDWSGVWAMPVAIAVGIGAVGELAAARMRYAALPATRLSRGARLANAFVPLSTRSRLEGADEERSRLAIELHNRVVPRVQSSAHELRREGSADAAASELDALAADLREVLNRHETVTLESGGIGPGLRAHLESVGTSGARVAFEIRDDGRGRPPASVELAAYRIGQAAIDNALRHSGGDRFEVSVFSSPDRVELSVKDDGVGISDTAEETARRQGRLGLAQMWLRAEAVGGSLDIRSRSSGGTEVGFSWSA